MTILCQFGQVDSLLLYILTVVLFILSITEGNIETFNYTCY